jgi:hypothetical protein
LDAIIDSDIIIFPLFSSSQLFSSLSRRSFPLPSKPHRKKNSTADGFSAGGSWFLRQSFIRKVFTFRDTGNRVGKDILHFVFPPVKTVGEFVHILQPRNPPVSQSPPLEFWVVGYFDQINKSVCDDLTCHYCGGISDA